MNKFMTKNASAYDESLLSLPQKAITIPLAGPLEYMVGGAHGVVAELPKNPRAAIKELNDNPAVSLLPSVSTSRLYRRQRLLAKLINTNKNLAAHRLASVYVNPLNLLAEVPAGLAAYMTPEQSLKERAKANSGDYEAIKTWLIPGYGTYQGWKDVGATNRVK